MKFFNLLLILFTLLGCSRQRSIVDDKLVIGTNSNTNVDIIASNDVGSGIIRYNTDNEWQFSNDGNSFTNFGGGGGGLKLVDVQRITGAGTSNWVRPNDNIKLVKFFYCGAGGGGGGCNNNSTGQ
jgi:hypothetical protein